MNSKDKSASRPQELDAIDEIESAAKYTPPSDASTMGDALEKLRAAHLPFRRVTPEDMRKLEQMRTAVTDKVTGDVSLAPYYEEAWNGIRAAEVLPKMALRRAVMAQLELMESVFNTLQLHHYANSPENTGWIELFRRWGASTHFNDIFDEIDGTLTPDFVRFYLMYLRTTLPHAPLQHRLREEHRVRKPHIHHPWLAEKNDRGHGIFMDSGLVEAKAEFPPPSGSSGEIDAKGLPGADQQYEVPSDAPPPPPNPPAEGGNE